MKYLDVTFPEEISYGSRIAISFNTQISSTQNGKEVRFAQQNVAIRNYLISGGIHSETFAEQIHNLFNIAKGQTYAFKYKDWANYEAINQDLIPIIDSTANNKFRLFKSFVYQNLSYASPIGCPIMSTFHLYKNGQECLDSFVYDETAGILSLNFEPGKGDKLKFSTQFYTFVRFNMDSIELKKSSSTQIEIPDILLSETIIY